MGHRQGCLLSVESFDNVAKLDQLVAAALPVVVEPHLGDVVGDFLAILLFEVLELAKKRKI